MSCEGCNYPLDLTKSCRERGDNIQNCHSCPDVSCCDNTSQYENESFCSPMKPETRESKRAETRRQIAEKAKGKMKTKTEGHQPASSSAITPDTVKLPQGGTGVQRPSGTKTEKPQDAPGEGQVTVGLHGDMNHVTVVVSMDELPYVLRTIAQLRGDG